MLLTMRNCPRQAGSARSAEAVKAKWQEEEGSHGEVRDAGIRVCAMMCCTRPGWASGPWEESGHGACRRTVRVQEVSGERERLRGSGAAVSESEKGEHADWAQNRD